MIHISIEGMDGVGKTTTCRLLTEKLGYKFVEKNLRFLFDENDGYDNYFRIRDKVNADSDRLFTSWFYGLGNVYLYSKFKDENIITDRHFLSNFAGNPRCITVGAFKVEGLFHKEFSAIWTFEHGLNLANGYGNVLTAGSHSVYFYVHNNRFGRKTTGFADHICCMPRCCGKIPTFLVLLRCRMGKRLWIADCTVLCVTLCML